MKFEVGQKWKNGKGEVVEIINVRADNTVTLYPVIGDNGAIYTSEGTYWSDRGSDDDLVELADEPEDIAEPKEVVAEPKDWWDEDIEEPEDIEAPTSCIELVGRVTEAIVDTQKLEAEFNEHIKEMKDIVGRLMHTAANRGEVDVIANLIIKLTALNKLGK